MRWLLCGGDASKKNKTKSVITKKNPAREFIPITVLIYSKKLNPHQITNITFFLLIQKKSATRISVIIFPEMVFLRLPPSDPGSSPVRVLCRGPFGVAPSPSGSQAASRRSSGTQLHPEPIEPHETIRSTNFPSTSRLQRVHATQTNRLAFISDNTLAKDAFTATESSDTPVFSAADVCN